MLKNRYAHKINFIQKTIQEVVSYGRKKNHSNKYLALKNQACS